MKKIIFLMLGMMFAFSFGNISTASSISPPGYSVLSESRTTFDKSDNLFVFVGDNIFLKEVSINSINSENGGHLFDVLKCPLVNSEHIYLSIYFKTNYPGNLSLNNVNQLSYNIAAVTCAENNGLNIITGSEQRTLKSKKGRQFVRQVFPNGLKIF